MTFANYDNYVSCPNTRYVAKLKKSVKKTTRCTCSKVFSKIVVLEDLD